MGPARVAMGARTLGRLTPRQRVAVVLMALIIAAGIYRWVVFGNVNTLHGGSTVHTLTGESEVFPTSTEVQAGARSFASREGKVTGLTCRQVASYYVWNCSLHFAGGLTAEYRGVWDESQQTLGWSVLQRKATLHFKVPIGAHSAKKQSETYETGYIDQGRLPQGVPPLATGLPQRVRVAQERTAHAERDVPPAA
jgi:hypothetical protein